MINTNAVCPIRFGIYVSLFVNQYWKGVDGFMRDEFFFLRSINTSTSQYHYVRPSFIIIDSKLLALLAPSRESNTPNRINVTTTSPPSLQLTRNYPRVYTEKGGFSRRRKPIIRIRRIMCRNNNIPIGVMQQNSDIVAHGCY